MKVLKAGGKPKSFWKKKVVCSGKGNSVVGCGALLEVTAGDMYNTYHYCYDGSTDTYYTFRCPLCKAQTDISEKDIPYAVQSSVAKKEPSTSDE